MQPQTADPIWSTKFKIGDRVRRIATGDLATITGSYHATQHGFYWRVRFDGSDIPVIVPETAFEKESGA